MLKFWFDNNAVFQMECILHPECNFLHSYLKCLLPAETVDVELKVKMMQGIHTGKTGYPKLLNAIPRAPGYIHTPP